MNLGTLFVLLVLFAAVFVIVLSLIRKKKSGGCCSCSNCAMKVSYERIGLSNWAVRFILLFQPSLYFLKKPGCNFIHPLTCLG